MERVKRRDLEVLAFVAVKMMKQITVQDYTDGLKSPKDQVIDEIVKVVLDQVFVHDQVVIRPDRGRPMPGATVQYFSGKWDVSEPWPKAFGPRPTRPEDI